MKAIKDSGGIGTYVTATREEWLALVNAPLPPALQEMAGEARWRTRDGEEVTFHVRDDAAAQIMSAHLALSQQLSHTE